MSNISFKALQESREAKKTAEQPVNPEKTTFIKPSRNLFNKETVVLNHYINSSGNLYPTSSDLAVSDFISVNEEAYYSFSFTNEASSRVVYFNEQSEAIGSDDGATSPILIPEGVRYVRIQFNFSGPNSVSVDDFQFEKGEELSSYSEFGVYFLDDNIRMPIESVTHLSYKNIVCFGDSITGGYSSPDDYPTFLANNLGARAYNVGFNGAKMSTDDTDYDAFSMVRITESIISNDFSYQDEQVELHPNYAEKLQTLKSINFNDVDIVTIFYGTNDYNSSRSVLDNENDEFDTSTVLGATRYAIRELTQEFPHLKIVLLSTTWRTVEDGYADDTVGRFGHTMDDLVKGLKSAADYHHIPFINMYDGLGINRYNYESYLIDGLHPNPTGRQLLADRIAAQLLTNF